ncbi:MAG: hypothetical protein LKF30_00505 [Sphingobium sp.]|nr:hypothetical protein [Sphingobium sp.]MCI2051666.1 hypothetical protein [Sphingobium sp.]
MSMLSWLRMRAERSSSLAVDFLTAAKITAKHRKITIPQLSMFFWIADRELHGIETTYSDLRDEFERFGRTVHTTYKVWFGPSPTFPHGVEWLRFVQDPADGRRRTMHMTEEGVAVMCVMLGWRNEP